MLLNLPSVHLHLNLNKKSKPDHCWECNESTDGKNKSKL